MVAQQLSENEVEFLAAVYRKGVLSVTTPELVRVAHRLKDQGILRVEPGHVGPDGSPVWWQVAAAPGVDLAIYVELEAAQDALLRYVRSISARQGISPKLARAALEAARHLRDEIGMCTGELRTCIRKLEAAESGRLGTEARTC